MSVKRKVTSPVGSVGRVDVARQLRSTHTGGLVDDVTARERLTSAVETRMHRSRE